MNSPFSPPPRARAVEAVAAVKVLARELSPLQAVTILVSAAATMGPLRDQLRQEARAASAEADTVDQAIAWSIAIYRQLQSRLGRWRALEVMHEIIVPSGLRLMSGAFPPLEGSDALSRLRDFMESTLGEAQRQGLYSFKPRTGQGPDRVAFDMTYCRYTDCCQVAGVPELAHSFCAVDRPFFEGISHVLEFGCPERLADGAPACTFCFSKAQASA